MAPASLPAASCDACDPREGVPGLARPSSREGEKERRSPDGARIQRIRSSRLPSCADSSHDPARPCVELRVNLAGGADQRFVARVRVEARCEHRADGPAGGDSLAGTWDVPDVASREPRPRVADGDIPPRVHNRLAEGCAGLSSRRRAAPADRKRAARRPCRRMRGRRGPGTPTHAPRAPSTRTSAG